MAAIDTDWDNIGVVVSVLVSAIFSLFEDNSRTFGGFLERPYRKDCIGHYGVFHVVESREVMTVEGFKDYD